MRNRPNGVRIGTLLFFEKQAASQGEMTDDEYLTYPGFDVSFRVPHEHDEDEIDRAIARIKRDVTASAERHLPEGCRLELQDSV